MNRILLPLWIISSVALFIYSFTQVSLSLALNKTPWLYSIQQVFQEIGYFNRPLSAALYIGIICSLAILFIITLRSIYKKTVTKKTLMMLIGCVTVITMFSYNAFSYDIFNYIFDAKIVTYYQENPYEHKALDYPQDPMLSFMHWTHRTYPYGPAWLGISIPISFAGLHYFLPTFFLFKALAAAAYLGTAWCIYKIGTLVKKESALFMTAFFALNPLMIIEFLVSGHNDIVMLFFAVLAVLLVLQEKRLFGILSFIFSIAIKFATAFIAPMMIVLSYNKKRYEEAVGLGVGLMSLAVIAASLNSGNFQPWYFSYVVVIASLVAYKKYIYIPVLFFSLTASLYYVPFLYTGVWDGVVRNLLHTGLAITCIITSVLFVYQFFSDTADKTTI